MSARVISGIPGSVISGESGSWQNELARLKGSSGWSLSSRALSLATDQRKLNVNIYLAREELALAQL